MASRAVSGVGTLFRRWNVTLEIWEAISEIESITGPGMSRDTIDVTSLSSTGGYREFIAGFRKGGTFVLKMNWTRKGFDMFLADFESDDLGNYEVVLPDPDQTCIQIAGLVTDCPLTIPTADKITMDVTITISGKPEVSSGASTGL
jgi:predicted secreted protein